MQFNKNMQFATESNPHLMQPMQYPLKPNNPIFQNTHRQCEIQRNPMNAIKSNFTTLPVTILHYLTQPNAVEEKYTTLKNSGAKVWVTHGRLRGLTFEHFQKKLSPGRG